jgi:hypothetical protein
MATSVQDNWTAPKRRRSSNGLHLLLALLIVAGVAGSIWYFFLRKDDGGKRPEDGTAPLGLHGIAFDAHGKGVGVTVIAPQTGGRGVYTGGDDGSIKRWLPPETTPAAQCKLNNGAITALVTRASGQRLVVGTASGVVMVLDAEDLSITSGQELRVEGRVTAILALGSSQLVVGDSNGRLTMKPGSARVQVGEAGQPVASLLHQGGEVIAVAGSTIARYKAEGEELVLVSKAPHAGGEIYNLISVDGRLFSVVGQEVRRMSLQGPAEGSFEVRFRALGQTSDGKYLVAVSEVGVVVLDPETLKPVATSALGGQVTILSIGCAPQGGRFFLGTRSGEVHSFTFK